MRHGHARATGSHAHWACMFHGPARITCKCMLLCACTYHHTAPPVKFRMHLGCAEYPCVLFPKYCSEALTVGHNGQPGVSLPQAHRSQLLGAHPCRVNRIFLTLQLQRASDVALRTACRRGLGVRQRCCRSQYVRGRPYLPRQPPCGGEGSRVLSSPPLRRLPHRTCLLCRTSARRERTAASGVDCPAGCGGHGHVRTWQVVKLAVRPPRGKADSPDKHAACRLHRRPHPALRSAV
eukprot:360395-Chlamydomonas_euryale.AAC.3